MDARDRNLKLAHAASLLSALIPSPVGDIVGFGADMVDPANRTLGGFASSAAGLIPGVPGTGARRIMGEMSAAGRAAAKDMPQFEDQMKMARTVLDQQKAAKGQKRLDHLFDPENGLGQVPNNIDIAKGRMGAVHHMTVDEYLNLAEPLKRPSQSSLAHIRKTLDEGKKLGNPQLDVGMVNGVPTIMNHDGRHRMMVLREKYGGDAVVPVHVKGSGPDRPLAQSPNIAKFQPQREADAELRSVLERADALIQQMKDRDRR
jgi:hypothetical protein